MGGQELRWWEELGKQHFMQVVVLYWAMISCSCRRKLTKDRQGRLAVTRRRSGETGIRSVSICVTIDRLCRWRDVQAHMCWTSWDTWTSLVRRRCIWPRALTSASHNLPTLVLARYAKRGVPWMRSSADYEPRSRRMAASRSLTRLELGQCVFTFVRYAKCRPRHEVLLTERRNASGLLQLPPPIMPSPSVAVM